LRVAELAAVRGASVPPVQPTPVQPTPPPYGDIEGAPGDTLHLERKRLKGAELAAAWNQRKRKRRPR
jgi:hypothetical protein